MVAIIESQFEQAVDLLTAYATAWPLQLTQHNHINITRVIHFEHR